jgi:hypothetical protein
MNWLTAGILMVGCAACSSTGAGPAQAGGSGSVAVGGVKIPPNAQWTILCARFPGAQHVFTSDAVKQQLIQQTKMPDWYVIHGEQESLLYYGFYASLDPRKDAVEGKRAQDAKKQVAALVDSTGQPRFAEALFVPIQSPDPNVHPEWNLANAKGMFTIEVMAFDGPDHKSIAEETVTDLREKGGYEAYYYNTEAASVVCIGAWPRAAIKEQTSDVAHADRDSTLVVTNYQLPDGWVPPQKLNGKNLVVAAPRLDILDPTLLAARAKWSWYAVNGVVGRHQVEDAQHNKILVEDPSVIVFIPQKSDDQDNPDGTNAPASPLGTTAAGTSNAPGTAGPDGIGSMLGSPTPPGGPAGGGQTPLGNPSAAPGTGGLRSIGN